MLHVNRILRELDLDAMKEADCFLVFSFNKPVIKVLLEGGKNMYIKVLYLSSFRRGKNMHIISPYDKYACRC